MGSGGTSGGGKRLPFYEWADHLATLPKPPYAHRLTRGYDPETWRRFEPIQIANKSQGFARALPIRALQAGTCPNESRVYFQLITSEQADSKSTEEVTVFSERTSMTRRKAGMLWDQMINSANEAVNKCIARSTSTLFEDLIGDERLRDLYEQSFEKLKALAAGARFPLSAVALSVQPRLDPIGGLQDEKGKPDGVWQDARDFAAVGGVLEAKLSAKDEEFLFRVVTAYALMAEHHHRSDPLDFDVGVIITWEPGTPRPRVIRHNITEDDRQAVMTNIEVANSLIGRAIARGQKFKASSGWEPFLVQPDTPNAIAACELCPYGTRCAPRQ